MSAPQHPPPAAPDVAPPRAVRGWLRFALAPLALGWALYAGVVFTVLVLLALAVILLVPSLRLRRSIVRAAARGFFALAGLPLRVITAEHLPAGACVVVANHASYLDGVLLAAVLPAQFSFVIKREMAGVPLAGLLLERIGAQFVERSNRQRGAGDARRALRLAGSGQSLAFFPEGTFSARPGLLRFHAGAFHIAVRAGLPVVPVVIRGTRRALPPDGTLPLPAVLRVEFLPALRAADADDEHAVNALREQSRHAILAALGEPSLVEPA
jgi:1-acyl-sn-glycerol-3-phosphate acyltransferase